MAEILQRTSSPICEAVLDTISWQFTGMRLDEDKVSLEAGIYDLTDDVFLRESYNQAIFGRVAVKIRQDMQNTLKFAHTICFWPG
jgi:hypothetical protein